MIPAVSVQDLTVELVGGGASVVERISFDIGPGEIVALVGESGSGKTTVGTALLGHYRAGARLRSGDVRVEGTELGACTAEQLRGLRGKVVAYVPQDPGTALNPALRIGRQLAELIELHERRVDAAETRRRIGQVLADVKLPDDDAFLRRFPHQLSGGQQQRVCLAMAFLLEPRVVVLDEPTTGLDVSSQAHVLATVRQLCAARGTAALYVTHDLSVVADLADRVMVMYAGRIVEDGPRHDVLVAPSHPYTRRLVQASPDVSVKRPLVAIAGHAPSPRERPSGCAFHPRCPLADQRCIADEPTLVTVTGGRRVACHHPSTSAAGERPTARTEPRPASGTPLLEVHDLAVAYGARTVVHGVEFDLRAGECLALVGESGSGKTTVSRTLIGLKVPAAGSITLAGENLAPLARQRSDAHRRRIQYVFQNPYASLNPRRTVGDILAKPIRHFHGVRGGPARQRVVDALAQVNLPVGVLDRYPRHLSGGERQRVAIARALVCEPDVLICDEVTSALDVSVQAAVVELLAELRDRRGLAMVFVTHNLALVRTVADRVLVMRNGRIVERGDAEQVLTAPTDSYTRQLLADTPSLHRMVAAADLPDPLTP